MAPAPNRNHQDISRNLEYILLEYLDDNPFGTLYHASFDVYLDEHNVFQPDILVVLNSRLNILTDAGAEGAPEFVVEILPPSNARLDLEAKRRVYARTGVKEFWIVSPEAQTIAIYFLQENAETASVTHQGTSQFTSRLFPGLEFHAKRIFAR